MIHAHSLGRAVRYYAGQTAFASTTARLTFRELHDRVAGIAATLSGHGFQAGDRLAMLLPNQHDYLELVYACAWLGVIAVPVNVRLSETEIDHVIGDASPRGLIRHSSLPAPTVKPSWELVLDREPLEVHSDRHPEPVYNPEATLALVYTSGTQAIPKAWCLLTPTSWQISTTSTTGCPIEKAAYIFTPRRFSTSWTSRSCSRHPRSARAK